MINTSGFIVVVPILGAAAAPEIAIAVPRFMWGSTSSMSCVGQYPVLRPPTKCLLKIKKSAFLPRRSGSSLDCRFKVQLIR
jgi:hypothetical protein